MTGDGPEMVHFGPKMAGLSMLQNGPKELKRDQNGVFDHLGSLWVHLDYF